MENRFTSLIFGEITLEISGTFAERVLNIASAGGVKIWSVKKISHDLVRFCTSDAGAKELVKKMPEALSVREVSSSGVPVLLRRYHRRALLFGGLPVLIFALIVYNSFIWRVEIEGGSEALQVHVAKELRDCGVRVGAYKYSIDSAAVRDDCVIKIDELEWLWVDVRGTTARVSIAERTKPPEMETPDPPPSDIFAARDGVIEKIIVRSGEARVKSGEAVSGGDLLVAGTIENERADVATYVVPSIAEVIARTVREKSVTVSSEIEKRVPSGKKYDVLYIKICDFTIKLSINSGNRYAVYDKITYRRNIEGIGVTFLRETYVEEIREFERKTPDAALSECEDAFRKELSSEGAQVIGLEGGIEDADTHYNVSMKATCLEDIGVTKEIDIVGENFGDSVD